MQIKSENDKEIGCSECGELFTFTESEQKFYAEKRLSDPKRCYKCRQARKRKFNEGRSNQGEQRTHSDYENPNY